MLQVNRHAEPKFCVYINRQIKGGDVLIEVEEGEADLCLLHVLVACMSLEVSPSTITMTRFMKHSHCSSASSPYDLCATRDSSSHFKVSLPYFSCNLGVSPMCLWTSVVCCWSAFMRKTEIFKGNHHSIFHPIFSWNMAWTHLPSSDGGYISPLQCEWNFMIEGMMCDFQG